MFSLWRLYLSFRALKLWGHKAALLARREGLWLKPAVKKSLTELNEKYSPCFFLLFHHYLIPFLLFATSTASSKDIKATGYIFITSNHIVFTASVYEAAAENENIFMALEALSSRLFISEGGKKNCPRSQDEKETQETKRENKLWACRRSTVVRHLPLSVSLSHFDEEEQTWGGGENFVFLFNVSVLSPWLSSLGPWRAGERATRRCGCLMGFSFWGGWSLSSGVVRFFSLPPHVCNLTLFRGPVS